MNIAQVDGIHRGQAFGSVAERLLANGMDTNALRPWVEDDPTRSDFGKSFITANGKRVPIANDTLLRKDEWKQYDTVAIKTAQSRLIGINDLIQRGLTYNISNGLGKTVLEYEDISDITAAETSMDAVADTKKDRPKYGINYLPLPITHKDFQINLRVLSASRTTGMPLDTTLVEFASRKVAERLEAMLFTDITYTFGGGTIYSYINAPDRNTGNLTACWDDESDAGGEHILEDVRAMKQASIDAMHYGPWVLYVATNFETALDADFKAASNKTVRQRILEIGGITDVKVADTLTADNVVLVQMTADVVRLVVGMPISTVQWDEKGGLISNYKVMTIQVPQIRQDQAGNSGITHYCC